MRSGGCPILMVTLIVVIIISSLYINKNCLRNNLKLAQEKPQVIVETKIVYITVTVPTEKTTTKKKTVRTTTEKVKESKFVDVNHVRSEKVKEVTII